MPVVDPTMQDEILAAWLGPARAAGTPDSYDFELWDGDPRNDDSAELDGTGGYASQPVDADDFALSGHQMFGPLVTGTATDAFSDTASHYVLRHPTSGGIAFCGPLGESLDVTGAGDWSAVPIVYFADPD